MEKMMGNKLSVEEIVGTNANINPAHIHIYDSLQSTNITAKELALSGVPHGTVVIADKQTAGRGRMGRSFYSPKSTGIYMSFVLNLAFDPSKAILITTAASVAVCRAIFKETALTPKIKWVNDIYLDGKKICGILTEYVASSTTASVILGIGINISSPIENFPPELLDIVAFLDKEGNKPIHRNALIGAVISEILAINETLETRQFLEEYKANSMILGQKIWVIRNIFDDNPIKLPATAMDIDRDGGLIVKYDSETALPHGQKLIETLNTGEISIRLKD